MLNDAQIIAFNPWWVADDWEADDPHLRRLTAQPARFPAPQVEEIDFDRPAVHVLRGPRQVGKSTDLKLLVKRALAGGVERRAVVYLSLDLLDGQPPAALAQTVDRALGLAGDGPKPRLILLDEVTSADKWQTGVKALWDGGRIDGDVLVCTGSSAIDLAQGAAERLPGRRGAGRDFLVLPQDFGSFAHATDPRNPPGLGLDIGQILGVAGMEEIRRAQIHLPSLQRALELYLKFGGLPAAVAEAAGGKTEPSEEVEAVLWDSFVKELQRRGASLPAAQALLERIARSLGSKVSWSKLAREMGVPLGSSNRPSAATPNPRTLQSYLEFIAMNYFALIVYFWKQDSGSGDLAKDKKIYFGDPLLRTITAKRTGLPPNPHAAVENAVALALYRRYEPSERRVETMLAPERLHVWGTSRGGEIDFVCGPRDEIEAVEVADWSSVDRRKATAPMRALPGRPALVATRDELEFGRASNLIPAALLLWALSG